MNALESVARTQRVNGKNVKISKLTLSAQGLYTSDSHSTQHHNSRFNSFYRPIKLICLTFSLPYMTEIPVVIRQ